MSSNELAISNGRGEVIEAVIAKGDLSKLNDMERVNYYRAVCESVGLNPLTRPFEYIILNGKMTLYARKDATDQLRALKGISLHIDDIAFQDELVIVTVSATDQSGRSDSDVGAVAIGTLKGEARANAIMKAITKAKRRVTLSCGGLGWLGEAEADSVPGAMPARVDAETGEILVVNPLAADVQFKPEHDERLFKRMHATGKEIMGAAWRNGEGRELLKHVTGKESTKDLSNEEMQAVITQLETMRGEDEPELVTA